MHNVSTAISYYTHAVVLCDVEKSLNKNFTMHSIFKGFSTDPRFILRATHQAVKFEVRMGVLKIKRSPIGVRILRLISKMFGSE